MSGQPLPLSDLLVLAADQNTLATVRGLMERRKSLRLNEAFTVEIWPHPERDPGCLLRAHDFLGPFQRQYRFALVIFDREGCGSNEPREALELAVEQRLATKGWSGRSASIAIDPELENWVWSDSPHVASLLGWNDVRRDVRQWLRERGELLATRAKPNRPKEAMENVLRHTRQRRTSAVYEALAKKVGLASCLDPAFVKFRTVLQSWFPAI